MASLDQLQRHLGFTDAALTGDQNAYAVDVDEHAVDRNARCQSDVEPADQFRCEVRGRVPRHEDRDAVLQRDADKELVGLQLPAEHDAGNVQGEEFPVDPLLVLILHLLHIGVFHQTDDLDPSRREVFKISRQLQRRTVDVRLPDPDLRHVDLRRQVFEVHLGDNLI